MNRLYVQKGHTATEADFLAIGSALLKIGYVAYIGKEKVGNTSRRYIEFYTKTAPETNKKTAPGGNDTESGKGN